MKFYKRLLEKLSEYRTLVLSYKKRAKKLKAKG